MKLAPFYPVLDTALWASTAITLTEATEGMLEGGARMLQFRHKGHFSRAVFTEAARMAQMCLAAGALFVVNDRADIAALLDAALHVGQDDLLPRDARKVLPARLGLGLSTHNEAQLREACEEPVDYVALGPIFATHSKDNPDPVVGLKELQRLRAIANKPLVAIGGITRERALAALHAGADAVAVIRDLIPEQHTKRALRARTEEWLQLLKT